MVDKFYTPDFLAEYMLKYLAVNEPKLIADFAAGDGQLLKAARRKFHTSRIIASDLDPTAIHALEKENISSVCLDFTLEPSYYKLIKLVGKKKCDLILLNPPFSCKGGKLYKVEIDKEEFTGSLALTFVSRALRYLNKRGQILCVLPYSCMTSQKDEKLRKQLETKFNLKLLSIHERGTFKTCTPKVAIVSLSFEIKSFNNEITAGEKKSTIQIIPELAGMTALLFRGKTSTVEIKSETSGVPYIHTTNIINNSLVFSGNILSSLNPVSGPGVILPRVGRPNSGKLYLLNEGESYVLSDCLFYIHLNSISEAQVLYCILYDRFNEVEELYKGTCARYATIRDLRGLLMKWGLKVNVVVYMKDSLNDNLVLTS